MTKWLERHEFVYKQPKLIPGKLNEEQPQLFIQTYNTCKAKAPPDEIILFMDAVHPEYQSQAVRGWLSKGEIKMLTTANTQSRLHITGAIDLNAMDNSTREYQISDKIIHIVCGNGISNKNKAIDEYLKNSQIVIHYFAEFSQAVRTFLVL